MNTKHISCISWQSDEKVWGKERSGGKECNFSFPVHLWTPISKANCEAKTDLAVINDKFLGYFINAHSDEKKLWCDLYAER